MPFFGKYADTKLYSHHFNPCPRGYVNHYMSLLAHNLQGDMDPFALAAKYCDRMVNIHPLKDGNARMCQLILNAILLIYASTLPNLSEKARAKYLASAAESSRVAGHSGQLADAVLVGAEGSLARLRNKLSKKVRRSVDYPEA